MRLLAGALVPAVTLAACGLEIEEADLDQTALALTDDAMCGQPFTVRDVALTSDTLGVMDHEFDHLNRRIAFSTRDNRVIVATLDRVTGDVVPGSAQVVDASGQFTMSCGEVPAGNGPEWAISQRGVELFFTYRVAGVLGIARAVQPRGMDGPWTVTRPLALAGNSCPLTSYHPADDVPALTYVKPGPVAAYALVQRTGPEVLIPEISLTNPAGASPGRQIPGRREVVFQAPDATGQIQIARKAPLTGQFEFVSDFAPGTHVVSIGVVAAPKYGPDANYFYANVALDHFAVFLSRGWGDNVLVATLRPPVAPGSAYVFLTDHENFVRDGESYLTMLMATSGDVDAAAEVWFASAEASSPCQYRRVSREVVPGVRRGDPEPLNVDGTTFVYYREFAANNVAVLRRADTGL